MNHFTRCVILPVALLACSGSAVFALPQEAGDGDEPAEGNKAKWLERLSKDDRAALDQNIGYAAPKLADDLKWSGQPATWDSLRGKVVVIQSWTSANPAAKRWPARIGQILKEAPADEIVILALHTPEGAADAEQSLGKQSLAPNLNVVIDPSGAFCDELGVWKNPVNIVIDRQGAVRYAGLNTVGLKGAVAELAAEQFDAKKIAKPRVPDESESPSGAETKAPPAKFPPTTAAVRSANDVRGKRAPDMHVDKWVTKRPEADGKVVVIDFWATWCPPCRASIPHMNQLASRFGGEAVFVGLSSESSNDFDLGMAKHRLKVKDFQYSLALDSRRTMSNAINVTGIPHCIVMSKDWIVRWQGNPTSLSPETLQKIIEANASLPAGGSGGGGASGGGAKKRGWTQ